MCVEVHVYKGNELVSEIDNVGDLKKFTKEVLFKPGYSSISVDHGCLCPVDLEKTLAGIGTQLQADFGVLEVRM